MSRFLRELWVQKKHQILSEKGAFCCSNFQQMVSPDRWKVSLLTWRRTICLKHCQSCPHELKRAREGTRQNYSVISPLFSPRKEKPYTSKQTHFCGPWLLYRGTSKNAVLPVKTIGEMGNWEPEITGVGDWAYTLRLPSLPSERKKHSCMPYKWKAQKTRPVPFCAYWGPSDREHRGRPQWHTIPLNWQHTEW